MFKCKFLQNFILPQYYRKLFLCDAKTELMPRFPHLKSELYQKLFMLQPNSPENSKVLKIAVLGCPNSGKSSLVNMLTRWDICAVSGKVNTTRSKQTAVLTQNNIQLCFVDMPGVIGKNKGFNFKLERSLIRDPHVGIFESDLIICLLDASHKTSQEELDMELLKALHFFKDKPAILVLNKIDKVGKLMKQFDIIRKVTNGIVGGRCSHKDSYANRFKRDVPDYHELLADSRAAKLLNKHLTKKSIEGNDANISEKVTIENCSSELEDNIKMNIDASSTNDPSTIKNLNNNDSTSENDTENNTNIHETENYLSPSVISTKMNEMNDEEFLKILNKSNTNNESLMIDDGIDEPILEVLKRQLMLNSATKEEVIERRAKWREIALHLQNTRQTSWNYFEDVFSVSCLDGTGIEELRNYLFSRAKPGLWYFHSTLITDQEPEALVKMCVMAKCLDVLEKEIPYQIKIDIHNYEKSEDGSLHIHVFIRCKNSRHLMSLLGQKGSNISTIADESKKLLEKCFQTVVYLKLTGSRIGIPGEHLKRMKSVTDIKKLYPQSSVA